MSKVNTIIEKIDAILGKLEGNAPYNQVLPIVRGLHTDIKAEFGHLIEVVTSVPELTSEPAPTPEPIIESIPTPTPVIEVEEEATPEVQEEVAKVEAEKPAPKKSSTSTAKSE